jgi:hypothetical protein
MLWMSVALLLFGTSLLVPDLIFHAMPRTRDYHPAATAPSRGSSSASLVDPIGPDADASKAAATDDPQRLDVRGNEIASPVARYRLDERGSLYEVHSPQTEMPRLKSPVM